MPKKSSSSDSLRKWFGRNKGKGWVNCKTGGPCGRSDRTKGGYPACRPTMAQCKSKAAKSAAKAEAKAAAKAAAEARAKAAAESVAEAAAKVMSKEKDL